MKSLRGLPRLVAYLATLPSPASVVQASMRGPLAWLDPVTVGLYRKDDDLLVLLALEGQEQGDTARRVGVVPVAVDYPLCAAARTGALAVLHAPEQYGQYQALAESGETWDELCARTGGRGFVAIPLHGGAGVIGAMIIASRADWRGDPDDEALLAAYGDAISLWLAHKDGGARAPGASPGYYDSIALTERQREIVLLIDEGMSTHEIGERLGFSESTIKQDIQRAMHALRSPDRRELVTRARAFGLLEEQPR